MSLTTTVILNVVRFSSLAFNLHSYFFPPRPACVFCFISASAVALCSHWEQLLLSTKPFGCPGYEVRQLGQSWKRAHCADKVCLVPGSKTTGFQNMKSASTVDWREIRPIWSSFLNKSKLLQFQQKCQLTLISFSIYIAVGQWQLSAYDVLSYNTMATS